MEVAFTFDVGNIPLLHRRGFHGRNRSLFGIKRKIEKTESSHEGWNKGNSTTNRKSNWLEPKHQNEHITIVGGWFNQQFSVEHYILYKNYWMASTEIHCLCGIYFVLTDCKDHYKTPPMLKSTHTWDDKNLIHAVTCNSVCLVHWSWEKDFFTKLNFFFWFQGITHQLCKNNSGLGSINQRKAIHLGWCSNRHCCPPRSRPQACILISFCQSLPKAGPLVRVGA